MNYLALYRKYRPVSFDEVYGQDAIVKTIKAALKNNKVSHAYLFSGPRGTGKTTVAKLIAKTVNCMKFPIESPCDECDICLENKNGENVDIIEIDAASNNGVDEIREIRNKVSLVPSISKYKVYIIDEVHMLTTGAFNALLKTLEEPPAHVIFILATTEPYKIPNTIISRCQRFDFKRVDNKAIVNRLKSILSSENIKIDDSVLHEIAVLSDGGMRDAISLLDQLIAYSDGDPGVEDIHLINGTLTKEELGSFILDVEKNNSYEVINKINIYNNSGKDFVKVVDELIFYIRDIILNKMNCEENILINEELINVDLKFFYDFIDVLLDVKKELKDSSYEKLMFEIAILKMISIEKETGKGNPTQKINNNADKVASNAVSEDEKLEITQTEVKIDNNREKIDKEDIKEVVIDENVCDDADLDKLFDEFKNIRINNVLAIADKENLKKIQEEWHKISEFSVDDKYGVYAGMLLDGEVCVAGKDRMLIAYPYSSISDRVNKCLDKVEVFINKVFDNKYKIICIDKDEWEKIKKEYIKNTKKNVNYELIDEKIKTKDIIVKKEIGKKKLVSKEIEDAVGLFGNEIVEIV